MRRAVKETYLLRTVLQTPFPYFPNFVLHGLPFLSEKEENAKGGTRVLSPHSHVVVMVEDGEDGESSFTVLTEDEVDKCMMVLTDLQHRAIFQLMVDTGMSVDEIIGNEEIGTPGIFIQDIQPRAMVLSVHYRFTSTDKLNSREVPIVASTLVAIQDWLASLSLTFRDAGRLFQLGERRTRQFLSELPEKAGVDKKISALVLRRTAMLRMLKHGLKPIEVRRRMGFVRHREAFVLSAMEYIITDETYFETIIRQTMLNSVLQANPTEMELNTNPSCASGAFVR